MGQGVLRLDSVSAAWKFDERAIRDTRLVGLPDFYRVLGA